MTMMHMPSFPRTLLMLQTLLVASSSISAFTATSLAPRYGNSRCLPSSSLCGKRRSMITSTAMLSNTRLQYSLRDSENSNDELQNLEQARAAFEGLISQHLIPDIQQSIVRSQPYLVLTSTGRRIRELEMDLLETLRHSDAAIEELIHLWTTERDQEASNALLGMQNSPCSLGLVQEEQALRDMCDAYPGWAEPYSRLATLLYYTGRVQEAVVAADVAVKLKPWHFEVLQLAALLASPDTCDQPHVRAQAQPLADQAMPPVSQSKARTAWVTHALQCAAQQLQAAHEFTAAQRHQAQDKDFSELSVSDIWQ